MSTTQASLQTPPYRTQLANGLTVLIHRTTAAPVVAINTYVKAGYFDETDDVVGIAHVLEHMFFKGTARRGVGEIAKATKAVGGYLNAHTIYDHTSYYTVLPSSSFAVGLDIQADAYANSVIDADELAKELEVIIQEAKRKEDNPGAVTTETLYALLFDRHRIRRWRIGRENGLRALTRDQLVAFYRNFYAPSNTILSIAGDVDIDHAMQLVEQSYGALPRHEPVRTPGPDEPPHSEFRYQELHGDVTQTHVEFGWRGVPSLHGDAPALDMVASVLGAGRASRLYRAVRERQLAGSVGAYNYTPLQVGIFALNAETEPHKATDAARAMWTQLDAVRNGDVSDHELERARRVFASRWARRLETSEGQAAHFAEWEAFGGWEHAEAYYDAFMGVRREDVVDVAQRYLAPERAGTVVYRADDVPVVAENAEHWHEILVRRPAAPLESLPAPAPITTAATHAASFVREEAHVRVYHTANEIPVLVSVRPGAEITYMGIYAAGGAVNEPAECAGISALTARSATKGTTTRTAVQIAEASELLGGSIVASVGGESFGWSMSVPKVSTEAAFALLADVAQHATLSDETLNTERTALLAELAQLRDDMYRYPMRLLYSAVYANHPYGIPASGTETSLRAITRDNVQAWYAQQMQRAPFVVVIVGDVDADTMAAQVAGELTELRMAQRPALAVPIWPAQVTTCAESRDKAQTALAIAFPSPPRTSDERFAAHMLSTIASGLGGRFFDELRDRQSLAYTVHAFSSEHRLSGAFVSYIATSPSQEEIARTGLLQEIDKLREAPVTADELTRAQRYLLGMHDIRQERGGAVLGDIIDAWLFGAGLHELEAFAERIRSVTPEKIQQLARTYFDPTRRVEGIVRGVAQGT